MVNSEDETEKPYRKSNDRLHVSQRAIWRFGVIEGCPACRVIQRRGNGAGRVGFSHSQACRDRITELMSNDSEYKHLVKGNQQVGDDGKFEALTIEDITIKIKHVKNAINLIKASMAAQRDKLAKQLDQTMLNMVAKQM